MRYAFLICLPAWAIYAQNAQISGVVGDPSRAGVPKAMVSVVHRDTGVTRSTTTNQEGYYLVPSLVPGIYSIQVEAPGFQTARRENITLQVDQNAQIDFALEIGTTGQSVTVAGDAQLINTQDASVSTVVSREFVENLPLNGRSFQSLIALTPGVLAARSPGAGNDAGQFNVNGQRASSNYFTVDGVSANVGTTNGFLGQSAAGAAPSLTALGTTQNLVSVDALQEFRVLTSTFAPEYGRTPGAQISMLTRSGTNRFHGAVSEYFRNDAMDANDWFANAKRLGRPALRQNDFGGVFGGPIIKDRTFFFFSDEELRLRLPKVAIIQVPSLESRRLALPAVQPFLNAYPIPNGPAGANGYAQFSASYSDPSTLHSIGLRVDHKINDKLTLFGRYAWAPSSNDARVNALTPFRSQQINNDSVTAGLSWIVSARTTNELRVNYSSAQGHAFITLDNFGGATPPPDSVYFPPFTTREKSGAAFVLTGGSTLNQGRNTDHIQRQINIVDSQSLIVGTHEIKVGVDYRRLTPHYGPQDYNETRTLASPTAVVATITTFTEDETTLLATNYSVYAQDTWRVRPRLTLTYGLRYELNPAPVGLNGRKLYTVTGVDNPASAQLSPAGTELYRTTYTNFAPRAGAAYRLSDANGRQTVLRGGFGVFYDLGTGPVGMVAQTFPFVRTTTLRNVPFPPDPSLIAPQPLTTEGVVGNILAFTPGFELPKTYQWNAAVEQALGAAQTLKVSYVGASGRSLLSQQNLLNPNPKFLKITLLTNRATSDYNSLQVEFKRRLSHGLQALAGYTWAHSLDTASSDAVSAALVRGPSDFDVRHLFTAAVSYNIPRPPSIKLIDAAGRGWSMDGIFRAQSGSPLTVYTSQNVVDAGLSVDIRPNLAPGAPVWLSDRNAPGGMRLNPAAFVAPPATSDINHPAQGSLGRNAIRGFGANQLDFTLRRQFTVTERFAVQFRAEFFNLFNHPNFANPVNLTFNNNFGQSISMLGTSLAGAGGLSSLYQIGGPRSTQLALKLTF